LKAVLLPEHCVKSSSLLNINLQKEGPSQDSNMKAWSGN
jgi:hypothetical protein